MIKIISYNEGELQKHITTFNTRMFLQPIQIGNLIQYNKERYKVVGIVHNTDDNLLYVYVINALSIAVN